MSLETVVFYIFGGLMVVSSVAIILSRTIIRSAVWLLFNLMAAGALYFLLSANFLGAIQWIVYAGGILILIVFGVMLTAKSPYVRFNARPREIAITALVGVILFAGLSGLMLATDWSAIPDAAPAREVQPVADIGRSLLTQYLIPFELVSVLLLAVMIGAAYLASPEKK
ncbi:MAG TPA: NADH-quinone oxidoreductase subunit J [Phycisphaerae bacterium]|nr:NADH-quinone oxidoreductase subunit J [Phycisphaerae bacterium]